MKTWQTATVLLLAVAASVAAAQDRSSPYDTNPACTERTSDASSPECVIQQEGEPRQFYPPPLKVKPTPPPPPTKPPAPATPASPLLSPGPSSGSGLR